MMLRSGQRRVSPPPFLPERPLLLQGNQIVSTQLPSQPTQLSSPAPQVRVKQEPEGKPSQDTLLRFEKLTKFAEDSHIPAQGLATERFTPYASHLPQSAVHTTMVKQEPGITLPCLNEPASMAPSQSASEVVTTAGARVPYAWVNDYTQSYQNSLASTLGWKGWPKADRASLLKTLQAAKNTMLELLTEEGRKKLDLENIPVDYTGLRKIARQLDLIIPHAFIPKDPDILPMDRMIRAAKKYISKVYEDNRSACERLQREQTIRKHEIPQ